MLDIRLIREKPKEVEDNLKRRNDPELIKKLHDLIEFDKERRELIGKVDELRSKRNIITKKIAELRAAGKPATSQIKEAEGIPGKIKSIEARIDSLDEKCKGLLLRIPNLLHESVPIGKDERDNVEIRKWGQKKFDFEPKGHQELLHNLGLLESEKSAEVSGHGFFYLKGKLAELDYALQRFSVDFLIKKGFTLVQPPFMLKRKPYEGVTDLADFENVMYKIENEDLYLIATSEHPIAALKMNEVILREDLPLKFVGISPCFRKEVGAHGKYTRGLFRMHQFNKVEQFVFCLPEQSLQIHEELQRNAEELKQLLEIPYRVVNVCTGDIGIIAAKKYDIEFLMADGNYREIDSNSNCTDYQARRLNIKYKEKEGQAPKGFVHTLNSTAIATSRVMIAIIENHQQADGSIKIPKALHPYTGFKEISKE